MDYSSSEGFAVVGRSVPRVDGVIKATGRASYCRDLVLPRMLFGKILRSPLPHARIVPPDTGLAERVPGVKAVITGKDTLGQRYGRLPHIPQTVDEYALAIDKVRYIGDEIAAVAAIDEETAEEALSLLKLEVEPLPPLFDPMEAIAPGAPLIHELERNIAWEVDCSYGDVEKGFKEADHIREDEFVTQSVIHCSLEPHASLASFEPGGKLTLWSTTQSPFFLRKDLAKLLGLPEKKVRVIQPFVGGGFGGKRDLAASDFCAALLSMRTERPVKIEYTRDEEFMATRRRHPMHILLKTGVKRDGTIVAQECNVVGDNGAYNSTGPVIIGRVGVHLTMQYRVPNFKCRAYLVYTNKPVCGAFRGFGFLQGCFANESQMDMVARDLGLDPVEFRLKNSMESRYVNPLGFHISSCGLRECLDIVATSRGRKEPVAGHKDSTKRRGLGFAAGSYICGTMGLPTAVSLELHTDGTVKLLAGGAEIGQGCQTTLCQIAAEELGISVDDVQLATVDTDVTPIDLGSFASRTTLYAGSAVRAACADAKRQLLKVAAQKLEAHIDDLQCRDRWVSVKGSPEKGMSFADAVRASIYSGKGMPIQASGYFNPDVREFDHRTLRGNVSPAYSYGVMGAEVEVDTTTGQVKLLRVWSAHDAGRVINPMALEGQVDGSVALGMGQALYENVFFDEGLTLNSSFDTYLVPLAGQVPEVNTSFVESVEPHGPFGAKGISEGTQLPVAPAIANAIFDAIGVRIKKLPITPHDILKALEKREGGAGDKPPRYRA